MAVAAAATERSRTMARGKLARFGGKKAPPFGKRRRGATYRGAGKRRY